MTEPAPKAEEHQHAERAIKLGKRLMRWAMLAGAVLGLVCHFLPHEYRAICRAVTSFCS